MSDTVTTLNAPVVGASATDSQTPTKGNPVEGAPPPKPTDFHSVGREWLKSQEAQKAAEAPVATEQAPAVAPEVETADDTGESLDFKWTLEENGQIRFEDGTLGPKIDVTEAGEVVTTEAEGAVAPAPEAEAPKTDAIKVTLPPRNPNEPEVEIEVSDPKVAEHLAHLKNGFMRKEEFKRRISDVEERETNQRMAQAMIEADPVGTVLNHIPKDVQAEVARALLYEHLQTLAPEIEQLWNNDAELRARRAETRSRITENRSVVEQRMAAERKGRMITDAIVSLIPETADPAEAERFERYAFADLRTIAARDGDVDPSKVAELLAPLARTFGFMNEPASPATHAGAVAAPPTPTPQPAPATATLTLAQRKAKALEEARRVMAAKAQRKAASLVPGSGAGAQPARPERPNFTTIEDASKWLKKNSGASWNAPSAA